MSNVVVDREPSPIKRVTLPLKQFKELAIEDGPEKVELKVHQISGKPHLFELRADTGWVVMGRDELRRFGEVLVELSEQS